MSQHLQRVERREQFDVGFRHAFADGVGKAEEERVAAGEDNDGRGAWCVVRGTRNVLLKHGIEGHGDVNPFGIGRQQRGDNLVVALAAREERAVLDDLQHLGWEEWLRVVGNAYYDKLHRSRPGFSCSASSKVRIALQSVAARLLPPLRPSTIILGISLKGFTMCFDSRTWTKPTGAAMMPAG